MSSDVLYTTESRDLRATACLPTLRCACGLQRGSKNMTVVGLPCYFFFPVHFHINRGQTISFLTYQDIKHMQRSWQTHSTQAQSMGSKQRDAINVRRAKEQLVVMGVSNRFNVSTISRSWLWYDKLKVFYNSDYWHKHHQRNKDLN